MDNERGRARGGSSGAGAGLEVAMLEVGKGFGCDVMRMRAKDGVQGRWSLVGQSQRSNGPWPGLSPVLGLVGGVAANLCVVEEGLSASRATVNRHGGIGVAFWSDRYKRRDFEC
jgi:hypothetical protein